jgi:mono/diheme cytochrome c family protein
MNVRAEVGSVLLGVYAFLASQAHAATPTDDPVIARGEHLARIVCSACHVVASDQEFPPLLNKPAPSFADIAERPGTSVQSLQRFILSTHWDMKSLPMTMPSQLLDNNDTRAVARYILTLKSE